MRTKRWRRLTGRAGLSAAFLAVLNGCGGMVSSSKNLGASQDAGGSASVVDAGPIGCANARPADTCSVSSIQAANYSQTCQSDLDCILVGEGQPCFPCSLACGPYGAINRSSLSRYQSDIAKTPGASSTGASCARCCGSAVMACCNDGRCDVQMTCSVK